MTLRHKLQEVRKRKVGLARSQRWHLHQNSDSRWHIPNDPTHGEWIGKLYYDYYLHGSITVGAWRLYRSSLVALILNKATSSPQVINWLLVFRCANVLSTPKGIINARGFRTRYKLQIWQNKRSTLNDAMLDKSWKSSITKYKCSTWILLKYNDRFYQWTFVHYGT